MEYSGDYTPLGKHAVPTLSRMGRTIETELYFKLNILDVM